MQLRKDVLFFWSRMGWIKKEQDKEGVTVEALTDFVTWLESDESGVSRYGFSNSSLEEIFLAVTGSAEGSHGKQEDEEADVKRGYCACSTKPKPVANPVAESELPENDKGDVVKIADDDARRSVNEIAAFTPVVTVKGQVEALLIHSFGRNWTGKESIGNWMFVAVMVFTAIIVGFGISTEFYPVYYLEIIVVLLSMMMITVLSPIYSDRALQLTYLMRTQGLSGTAFVLSTCGFTLLSFSMLRPCSENLFSAPRMIGTASL
jgi:hypothetical protein